MKLRVLVCGICLVGSLASAQVGNWQVQIQETNGARGKGFGYLQVKQDGTMVGYSLTTTTYGVVTFGGNWSIQSKKISGTFTESLDGQEISGTFKGTFTAKSFSVKVLLDDGSTSTLSGKPVVSVPNASGTFSGSVKQSGDIYRFRQCGLPWCVGFLRNGQRCSASKRAGSSGAQRHSFWVRSY